MDPVPFQPLGLIAHFIGGSHNGEMLAVQDAPATYQFPAAFTASLGAAPTVTFESYALLATGPNNVLYAYIAPPK